MRPNIEVMCIVKFQYATSAILALSLPYDHFSCFVTFSRCANHCYSAIPTFNFIFECLIYLTCIAPFLLLIFVLNVFLAKTRNKVAE